MSCINPRAPRWEIARGLNSDSTAITAATSDSATRWRTAALRTCAAMEVNVSRSAIFRVGRTLVGRGGGIGAASDVAVTVSPDGVSTQVGWHAAYTKPPI